MPEKRITVWLQHYADRPFPLLQWVDPQTGRRRSQSSGTAEPEQAEQARTDKEYELNHGLHREVSRMSWERFRELFEEEYVAGKRPSTRRNYAATLDQLERICHPRSLAGITERTVSQFVVGLRQTPGRKKDSKGMQASSIRVRLQFLRTALLWAVEQGMLPKCPKFPAVKVPKKDPQPVPVESFERLLDKAPDTMMRAYLLCGWLAGLRLSEAFALQREPSEKAPYLDLARRRIVLPAEFVKAVKDQWVPLAPELGEVLAALPCHGSKVFRFVNYRGEPLSASGVSQRVRYLAKRAGVRLTMHTLRKGFGCRHAGKVPAQVLQRLMRHANIKTTMDYYANVDAAVEEAILGQQHNTLHNSGRTAAPSRSDARDATPCQDSPNSP